MLYLYFTDHVPAFLWSTTRFRDDEIETSLLAVDRLLVAIHSRSKGHFFRNKQSHGVKPCKLWSCVASLRSILAHDLLERNEIVSWPSNKRQRSFFDRSSTVSSKTRWHERTWEQCSTFGTTVLYWFTVMKCPTPEWVRTVADTV